MMKMKRSRTVKQEQNAILKGTFREQNQNEEGGVGRKEEGGRRKKERGNGNIAEILKTKSMEGWKDKGGETSQKVEQMDKAKGK